MAKTVAEVNHSINRGSGLRMRQYICQSGIGLPHSTTSRKEWRAIGRDSVVECGSPLPLFLRNGSWSQKVRECETNFSMHPVGLLIVSLG
jgi:hypothetical protein